MLTHWRQGLLKQNIFRMAIFLMRAWVEDFLLIGEVLHRLVITQIWTYIEFIVC